VRKLRKRKREISLETQNINKNEFFFPNFDNASIKMAQSVK